MTGQQKPLPDGALPIAQARQRGLKPAGNVIVSYVGPTHWDAHHVFCESGVRYEWAWSEGLPLTIVVKPDINAMDAIKGCFWSLYFLSVGYPRIIDIEQRLVSHAVQLVPEPVLWHLKDTSEYFPEDSSATRS